MAIIPKHNHHEHCCGPDVAKAKNTQEHDHDSDDHDHEHGDVDAGWLSHWPLLSALIILVIMQILDLGLNITFPKLVSLGIYGIAFILSGYQVLELAYRKALRLDFFNEFFLMSVATIGAFAIGSYSEGVAVMVFYSIGEWFQDAAVAKAKNNIKALLDIRPDSVDVVRAGKTQCINPAEVRVGDIIEVKPGEKVALDGTLLTERGSFNTAALTGESVPDTKEKGSPVLAGMINLNQLIQIEVGALFKDSKLSKILEMVQDATARKSQTQLFISRFAKIYTPIVFGLALLVVLLPMLFVTDYHFKEWLYRGLVFLVISCPCALVVSIPLGYFGGIGLASKNGILFKGSNFLDVVTQIDTVIMDKTGTLTKGVFKVQQVVSKNITEAELVRFAAAIESKSAHPVAKAVTAYAQLSDDLPNVEQLEEIPGHGLAATVGGKSMLAGNTRLLKMKQINYDQAIDELEETVVVFAVDGAYAGYMTIADEMKDDAQQAIKDLHALHIQTVMLSGDKQHVVKKVAAYLGIKDFFGDLLPEDKVKQLEKIKATGKSVAFVGDGVNDAPVIALADAGFAMGGLGSDAAIETADIVIQNDQPSKIVTAIKIGKITKQVVWQNIILAMTVKILVLILGAGGIATLWEAVIADVGVALLAILNAVRIQRMKV
ncbi:MAG: cadmium-translocating P-type ATPase [Pedobacter sp.]|nr:MAG: cadmium-translocating P-type ATPase [Pedobacter sp.]